MPNWCHNKLTVSGSEDEVARFVADNRGEDEGGQKSALLFSKSVPEPDYGEDSESWHSWRIANWGTKWEPDCGNEQAVIETKEIAGNKTSVAVYNFETAWGPGWEWLYKTAPQYKALSFCLTYGEPGMGFGGSVIYRNGEVADESEGTATEYLDSDTMWF